METTPPIKKEGPELDIQGTPTTISYRGNDYTLSDRARQVPLGTKDWDGTDHPYYQLHELIEEAQCMLLRGPRRQKKTVIKFINRIIHLMPWLSMSVRGAAPRRLSLIGASLNVAAKVLEDNTSLSLTPKAAATEAAQILQEARQMLADLIVADEDAKFPGCRNDEGCFLEDKAREALNER